MAPILKQTVMKNLVITTMNDGKYVSGRVCGLESVDKKPSRYLVKYANMVVAYDVPTFKKIMASMLVLLKLKCEENGVHYLASVYADEFDQEFEDLLMPIGLVNNMFHKYIYTRTWPITLNMQHPHCLQIMTKHARYEEEIDFFMEPPHAFIQQNCGENNTVFVDVHLAPVEVFKGERNTYTHTQQKNSAQVPSADSFVSGDMYMITQAGENEKIECEQREVVVVDIRNTPKRRPKKKMVQASEAETDEEEVLCKRKTTSDTDEEYRPFSRPRRKLPTIRAEPESNSEFSNMLTPYTEAFFADFIDKPQFERAVLGLLASIYDDTCVARGVPSRRLDAFTERMNPQEEAWKATFQMMWATAVDYLSRCSDERYIPLTIILMGTVMQKNGGRPSLHLLRTHLSLQVVLRFVTELNMQYEPANLGLKGTPMENITTAKELLEAGILHPACYQTFVQNTTETLQGTVVERLTLCKELVVANLVEKPLYDGLVKKWLPFCF